MREPRNSLGELVSPWTGRSVAEIERARRDDAMTPSSDDIRRLNPSSKPRWDTHDTSPNYIVSPRKLVAFPTIAQAERRRRQAREKVIARAFMLLAPLGGLAMWADHPKTGLAFIVIGIVGFAVTCIVTGKRNAR